MCAQGGLRAALTNSLYVLLGHDHPAVLTGLYLLSNCVIAVREHIAASIWSMCAAATRSAHACQVRCTAGRAGGPWSGPRTEPVWRRGPARWWAVCGPGAHLRMGE